MIQPAVGRVVWYWDADSEHNESGHVVPRAAIVTKVHSDRFVNLVVFGSGVSDAWTSVKLVQDEDGPTFEREQFCEHPPWVRSQAMKVPPLGASLEQRVDALEAREAEGASATVPAGDES